MPQAALSTEGAEASSFQPASQQQQLQPECHLGLAAASFYSQCSLSCATSLFLNGRHHTQGSNMWALC